MKFDRFEVIERLSLSPASGQFTRKREGQEALFVAGDEGGDAVKVGSGAGGAGGQPIHLGHYSFLFMERR
ncbi:hypothetical protein U717_05980 [Rhodobacter capsulatus R121]|nr:hypothetical protein U714_05975 [Rhodobacter capsulatus DE442]ETD78534.1 hypothetical protein U717_05980 [Rhodobacter capsulatus R121]ETE54579.1 hypothetical protein U715_05975 [Rhodobacter capsulatus Y262]